MLIQPLNPLKERATALATEVLMQDATPQNFESVQEVNNPTIKTAGFTDLHWAVLGGKTVDVAMLLKQDTDKEARSASGMTALHIAASLGHDGIIILLLTAGAKTEAKNAGGFTPLHCAAEFGHVTAINLLLQKKANVNAYFQRTLRRYILPFKWDIIKQLKNSWPEMLT